MNLARAVTRRYASSIACDQANCGGARGCIDAGKGVDRGALMKKKRKRVVSCSTDLGTPEGCDGNAAGLTLGRQSGQSPTWPIPAGTLGGSESGFADSELTVFSPRLVQISSQGELAPDQAGIVRAATGARIVAMIANIAIQVTVRIRCLVIMATPIIAPRAGAEQRVERGQAGNRCSVAVRLRSCPQAELAGKSVETCRTGPSPHGSPSVSLRRNPRTCKRPTASPIPTIRLAGRCRRSGIDGAGRRGRSCSRTAPRSPRADCC